MMNICKAMKANPNFPSAAALYFHSTSLLSLKKRSYWPERRYTRGPPRPRYVFVSERFQVTVVGDLTYRDDRSFGASDEKTDQNHSKNSNSSKSFEEMFLNTRASDRLTLGLPAAGPLNLEDVKSAYRSCALKWHPDHHHGSSKVLAEEKFKNCNAAYKSLCDQFSSS